MQAADLAHVPNGQQAVGAMASAHELMLLVSQYVPAASKILLIELSAIAAVNSPTVLADTTFRCRPRSATSEAVVVMTGPVVGLLATIMPGALGALG